jgi:hypothetical protein
MEFNGVLWIILEDLFRPYSRECLLLNCQQIYVVKFV